MVQNIGGIHLEERFIEKMINFMLEQKLIKPFASENEKNAVIKNMKTALESAFENGNVPLALLNDPAQMKKMALIVESVILQYQYSKDPATKNLAALFNPAELANALFSPEMDKAEAKKTIFNFLMVLRPPGPGSKKKCEDLSELLMQHKHEELHDLDAEKHLDNALKEELNAYLYRQREDDFVQAYGSSPDGTPVPVMGAQRGNSISAEDRYVEGESDKGYARMDADTSSVMTSGEMKSTIEHKKLDMGILDAFCDEMESTLKIASAPKPTPGGTRT
jgi:hypothetical protein